MAKRGRKRTTTHKRHGRGLRAFAKQGSGLTAYSKGGRIHKRKGRGIFDSILGGLFG